MQASCISLGPAHGNRYGTPLNWPLAGICGPQLILVKHLKTSLDILNMTLSLQQDGCVSCVNAPIKTKIENENANLYKCKSDV